MIIVDDLSLKSLLVIINFLIKKKTSHKKIYVLDKVKSNFKFRLLSFVFSLFNLKLEEAKFYAGQSFTHSNENIFIKSRELMESISINMAKNAINSNIWLKNLNNYWTNNTLLLFLSKCFYEDVEFKNHLITKYFISDMLARKANSKQTSIFFNKPEYFEEEFITIKSEFIKINWYKKNYFDFKNYKFFMFFYILLKFTQAFINDIKKKFQKNSIETKKSSLLLIKEDDLSMDRSLRTQPHWLFENEINSNIQVIILSDNETDEQSNIKFKNSNIIIHNNKKIKSLKIYDKQQKKILSTLINFFTKKNNNFNFKFLKLNIDTYFYIGFCKKNNIKAFMTSENYLPISTSMNMISAKKLLKSFSFQYSNMDRVSPIMQTTSDFMFTFGDIYHDRWTKNNIKPKKFISVGYTYSSSFPLVLKKKSYYEKKLSKLDNDFFITYFDENFQNNDDKFGFLSKNVFCNEISKLTEFAKNNKNIKIITKSQFMFNSAISHCSYDDLQDLIRKGKWIEISEGHYRNIVLPSEATICSDITIGHAFGATSSLESALFGKRSILINPHKVDNDNTKILENYDVIYPDIDTALSAINEFRAGNIKYKNIGIWGETLKIFDNYRDYKTASRMNNYIYSEILK